MSSGTIGVEREAEREYDSLRHVRLQRWMDVPAGRQRALLAGLAALVMLVLLWLFSPSYVLWYSLRVPALLAVPETFRAIHTLFQLQDPFIDIDNFSNKVIEWRLLFPLIFHYLRLPAWLFLALPWIGCLLTLWYLAHVLWRRTGDLLVTAAGLVLLGATSWFFTSTGWLAYFDSWYVLGALVLAFSPSRALIFTAALLTPWVDERVLFMLPACLVTRGLMHWHDTGRVLPERADWQRLAAGVAPLVAYALVRSAAALWFDRGSSEYVAAFATRSYPAGPLALGTWMGLRLAWVPVLALPLLLAPRSRVWSSAAAGAALLSLAIALVLAGDVSRSMSMLLPLALAGVILLAHSPWPHRTALLVGAALGNLLLPASHVVSSFTTPIFAARYEVFHHLNNPPPALDPVVHATQAMQYYRSGQLDAMGRSFSYAAALTRAPAELALMIADLGEQERQRRPAVAVALYRQALSAAPVGWPQRALLESRLQSLEAALPAPADSVGTTR